MTFKNNRANLLCLCIISQPWMNIHLSYSPETFKSGRIWRFFAPCDLEILQTTLPINHIFYTNSSFTHHFIDTGGFRFELESGNAQIGSNLMIFCLPWPWNFADNLEKNRAPLIYPLKLYASFGSHRWIPIWVTVRKRTNWVLTSVTLTFDLWRTDRRTDGETDRTIHRSP